MHKKYLKSLRFFSLYLMVVLLGISCASTSALKDDAYLASAQKNFDMGVELLDNERYEEAISYFEHVRGKFPYSQYSALSDLKIAECYFNQKKWIQAADSYDFFLRFHPRHAESEFATFRLGQSYMETLPSDFFLFPKSHTRDQKTTKDALNAFNTLLERFPTSKYRDETLKMKASIVEKLALHDMNIARFYQTRKRWPGALKRFESVAELYPESSSAPEALYLGAQIALNELGDKEKAKKLFAQLKEKYEKSSFAELAHKSDLADG